METSSEQMMAESENEPSVAKKLTPAAERALAEAAERRLRVDRERAANPPPREIKGPKGVAHGAEPTRYGDWEIKGIVSDF